jgi:RimJ/RimL family protein N-acetyltransferase
VAKHSLAETEKAAKAVIKRYPQRATLRDGRTITLRLMGAGDRDPVLKFARALPPDDLLFLRTNITQKAVIEGWIANIASGHTLTVLALEKEAIAGYASLHLNEANWMRHIGEIRMLAGARYRGLGLGRLLASEVFRAGRTLGLRKLSAQMTLDQAGARATFERLGFRAEALLADWVISGDGRTRDLLVMAYALDGLTDTVDG